MTDTASQGIGIGHPTSSTQVAGVKRRRVTDSVLEGDIAAINQIQNFMDAWKEKYEDGKELLAAMEEQLVSLKELQEFKKNNEAADIKAIALSDLTRGHMERLDVTIKPAAPVTTLLSLAQEYATTRPAIEHEKISEFWTESEDDLMKHLDGIQSVTGNPERESYARMLIDPVVLLTLQFLDQKVASVLFTEFVLSKGTSFPVSVQWTDAAGKVHITFLTGRVDYILFMYLGSSHFSQTAKLALQTAPSEAKAYLKNFESDEVIKKWWSFDDSKSFQVVVIEAKPEERANLDSHLPQVVGECLIAITVARRAAIPWCLTTGETWIFGIAVAKHGSEGCTIYPFNQISWSGDEATRTSVLKTAFEMLVYLSTLASRDIVGISEQLD